jgi:hypothetical protein
MRTLIAVAAFMLALNTCVASAQDQSDSPTEVGKIGFYTCPTHPQIQATWPTRCPSCQHVLQEAQPSATTVLGATLVADKDDRERREREERAERRYYGYGPGGYYPYAPYAYPYGGYNNYAGRPYYNPSYGYYNPNTGFYFNPNTGYYYNPDTGQGFYAQGYVPNYTYPYYRYGSPPYGYYRNNYPNEQAWERANRERREREEQEKRERRDRD